VAMIHQHRTRYPRFTVAERLAELDMTPADCSRLETGVDQRRRRESAIPEDDVAQTVAFIVEHPEIGAERARLTLLDQERAMISTVFVNEARQEVKRCAEEQYRERDQMEKEVEKALRERQAQNRRDYSHIQARRPHHIWAMDFAMVDFLGYRLALCEVYDVYSQAYLAVRAGDGCSSELAEETLRAALAGTGGQAPGTMLRRDNGAAFRTEQFQEIVDKHGIRDAPIPPGQPWHNGSLEAGNGSLRTAILATAMREALLRPETFDDARAAAGRAVGLLDGICQDTRRMLNEQIARPKFDMPPARVVDGEKQRTLERQQRFRDRKKAERAQRMKELRSQPARPDKNKSFLDKVRQAIGHRIKAMTTDQLYVLNEVIHGRFKAVQV
jgi:transposase InsO family protein